MSGKTFMDIVKSDDIKLANANNKLVGISYNPHGSNMYKPDQPSQFDRGEYGVKIEFNIPAQVIDLLSSHSDLSFIPTSQREFLTNELTAARLKGTIMHELSHWINDSIHNSHIRNRIKKTAGRDFNTVMNKGVERTHQFLTDYELDAQIHAIIQYRNENRLKWDSLQLDELLSKMPFYFPLSTTVTRQELKEWKRYILKRLAREGLLGKRMRR
jgi:hypothetical protein